MVVEYHIKGLGNGDNIKDRFSSHIQIYYDKVVLQTFLTVAAAVFWWLSVSICMSVVDDGGGGSEWEGEVVTEIAT